MTRRDRARAVDNRLAQRYPDAALALRFSTPLELLVAVILSAQCTDERVNEVTPALFSRFSTAADLASAPLEELENLIRSTGFFRNKARLVRDCCAQLMARYSGEVPDSLQELITLPGVGRKTANMVIGNAFHGHGIAVDTHVKRVVGRLSLSPADAPDRIEQDLCALLPRERWTRFSNAMILFGREVCRSRSPECRQCPMVDLCPHGARQTGASRDPS